MILSATEWADIVRPDDKPWLVLGKGPSFSAVNSLDQTRFFTCALNHVLREQKVDLAHIIDVDVVEECAEEIEANATYLAMPWHPHVDHTVSRDTLVDFIPKIPVLQRMAAAGRLVCYNLSSARKLQPFPGTLDVTVRYFSAEAAVGLLAACGVSEVRTLGVDGGTAYSSRFEDLENQTLLTNGRTTFDGQFDQIREVIRNSDIVYGPATIDVPIRVFVGCDPSQLLALRVLEYSIKRHASVSVELIGIDNTGIPSPVDPKNRARTGFSFSRFTIPALCNYRGRAIYLDADMLVFSDILDLWARDFAESDILYSDYAGAGKRIPQYSVLLLNCAGLNWHANEIIAGLDCGEYDYKQLMHQFCILPDDKKKAALPEAWNSLEHYEAGNTKLLHYTDMPQQPWVSSDNPHGAIWYAYLNEAIDSGAISEALVRSEIERGHVSPALPRWLGRPASARQVGLEKDWVAPYEKLSKTKVAKPALADPSDPPGLLARARLKFGFLRAARPQ